MLNKEATKFLKYKLVQTSLAGKVLTDFHIVRLNRLFSKFRCRELANMHQTIVKFILYDLNNYEGRLRRLHGIPGTSRYTQLLRYGKKEFSRILQEQSLRKTKHFPNRIEFWTNKGISVEEAVRKISEIQTARSQLSPSSQQGANEYSIRCVGYWIKKGYSEEEAKQKVIEVQRRRHTPERNRKWLATLNSKSDEEKQLINLKKGHSIESFMARGYDKEASVQASIEYYARRQNYSKSSQAFFGLLESLSGYNGCYYKVKNYEKQFHGKCVDFYDDNTGIVVEYYGDFWHRNPRKYPSDFLSYGKTSQEIWEIDKTRVNLIKSHPEVSDVIIVWESEVIKNPHQVAENIIKEMKNARGKRNLSQRT